MPNFGGAVALLGEAWQSSRLMERSRTPHRGGGLEEMQATPRGCLISFSSLQDSLLMPPPRARTDYLGENLKQLKCTIRQILRRSSEVE